MAAANCNSTASAHALQRSIGQEAFSKGRRGRPVCAPSHPVADDSRDRRFQGSES